MAFAHRLQSQALCQHNQRSVWTYMFQMRGLEKQQDSHTGKINTVTSTFDHHYLIAPSFQKCPWKFTFGNCESSLISEGPTWGSGGLTSTFEARPPIIYHGAGECLCYIWSSVLPSYETSYLIEWDGWIEDLKDSRPWAWLLPARSHSEDIVKGITTKFLLHTAMLCTKKKKKQQLRVDIFPAFFHLISIPELLLSW